LIQQKQRLQEYEAMHMIQKGQVKGVGKKDVNIQIKFIESLFRIAA